MKKDISTNLHQKRLILTSKILLNVLNNMGLAVLLPWQHTRPQTSSILKAFLTTFGLPFLFFCKWCFICRIQQAYKYVSLSLWPRLMFFELKIPSILKSSRWGLEKSELPRNRSFHNRKCVSCRTISPPSFNGLHCKLAKIALFIKSIFKSLVILAMWLALCSAIYSRIGTIFCSKSHLFLKQWEWDSKTKQKIRF